jgi:hypothetical protein
MSLPELYRCARSLEAIENFARAELSNASTVANETDPARNATQLIERDQDFWSMVLAEPEQSWGLQFHFSYGALSLWIARVPGLFWSQGAKALRKITSDIVEYKSKDWVVLRPSGKSRQVLGGIGTIKFPPDENGFRVVSLSCGHNASSGIPVLISPAVWEHHKLSDGSILELRAKWQPMATTWAERFPSIKGIPRGHLVVNDPNQVFGVLERHAPTQFHPCTVMEYYQGDAKLYDFVYATADSGVDNYREEVETFFEQYRKDRGRFGRYLISADIANPLWEADYDNPAALQRAEPGSKSQLELLQMRVRGDNFKGRNLELIVQLLTREYDNDGLRRISQMIDIPAAHWFTGGTTADSTVQLVHVCVDRNKVEELLDAVAIEFPRAFI